MAQDFKKAFEEREKINSLNEGSSLGKKKEVLDASRESGLERVGEKRESDLSSGTEAKKALEKSGEALQKAKTASVQISDSDKELMKKIDGILSEGLTDVFLKMDASKQQEFKVEGEKTVLKIKEVISHTRFKVKKVIELIKAWLKIIPGVNRYFLEQEAKIKADKIIKLKK